MNEWQKIEAWLGSALDDLFMEALTLGNAHTDQSQKWTDLLIDAKSRYERGRVEHESAGTSWASWTVEEFAMNMREELIDYLVYAAARRIALCEAAA